MRRIFFAVTSLVICFSFLLGSFLAIGLYALDAEPTPEMGSIEEIVSSYYDLNGRPMSCAHRAISYIGNPIPENSLVAIQDCIDHKVDIVEIDIRRTKDGVFVICHDDTIKRTTTYTGSLTIADMTYEEICKYPLLQYTGGSRDVYFEDDGNSLVMPTFEQVLDLCKGKVMINLDKFTGQWDHRMELYEMVKSKGCLDIVMFKGGYDSNTISGWHNEIKAKHGNDAKMPNFCTLNSNRDAAAWVNEIKAHYDAKTAFAVEAGFSNYDQPQSNPTYIAQVKQYTRVFANVLFESLGGTYSAKNMEDSTGWAEIISLGYNILQTNNAADLAAYIYANYSTPTKDSGKTINMIHFTDFKHHQVSYTIEVQSSAVKLYDEDYIGFSNVDFGTTEANELIVNIADSSGDGELVIRKDSPSGKAIARFDLSGANSQAIALSANLLADDLGVCDVYVCAEDMGSGYVTVSKMVCADPTEGEIKCIVGLSVFTRPGVAPALPDEILVINEYGFHYNSSVEWAQIPEKCYEEELTCFNVPGTLALNSETVYASVTVIDLDMSDAALWYDSNGQMLLGESGEVLEWYDSISSNPAIASSGSAPTYKDGIVSFDGSNDNMTYNHSLSDKGKISVIINAKTDKSSTGYLNDYKINNSARYTLLQYPESGSWGSVYFTAFKNGVVCRFGSGESNNRGIYYTGTTVDGWSTVSAVKNGTSEKIYLNSEMVYDRSTDNSALYHMGNPGSTIKATHNYAYIGLGIQNTTKYYYNGDVADIVIFERTLSDAEIVTLSEYFNAKNQKTLTDNSDLIEIKTEEHKHSLEYTFVDAVTHKITCSDCSYEAIEEHIFECAKKDGEIHVKSCTICSYQCEESHDYKTTDAEKLEKCSACDASREIENASNRKTVVLIATVSTVAVAAAVAFVFVKKKKCK